MNHLLDHHFWNRKFIFTTTSLHSHLFTEKRTKVPNRCPVPLKHTHSLRATGPGQGNAVKKFQIYKKHTLAAGLYSQPRCRHDMMQNYRYFAAVPAFRPTRILVHRVGVCQTNPEKNNFPNPPHQRPHSKLCPDTPKYAQTSAFCPYHKS